MDGCDVDGCGSMLPQMGAPSPLITAGRDPGQLGGQHAAVPLVQLVVALGAGRIEIRSLPASAYLAAPS